eukprot:bmy_00574T0
MRSGGSTLLWPRAAAERLYLKATPCCSDSPASRCCTRSRTRRRTSVFSLFSPYREASQRGRNAKKGQGGAGAGNNEQV